ncbi:MAG: hypothetical protein U1E26_10650 [Coriobacteriia bacterium]|nr:hypothetical protein [Coriobacteriia bacterium]
MLKNKLELIRDGSPQVLLTWHKHSESGEVIPVAIEYLDDLEPEVRTSIENIALRPVLAMVEGTRKRVAPGTSAHFLALPRVLSRLGFRTRQY